jgi:hypothetical protein
MLRVSAQQTEREVDIQMINGEESVNPGLEHAKELADFAEAVASFDEDRLAAAREALVTAAGPAVLVDAAGVAANFQRMVRIADSMGIPVDDTENEFQNNIREELDLYRFRSAENSRSAV